MEPRTDTLGAVQRTLQGYVGLAIGLAVFAIGAFSLIAGLVPVVRGGWDAAQVVVLGIGLILVAGAALLLRSVARS